MNDDDYQKGYRAGQRRQTAKDKEEARNLYWRTCYVAAMGPAMEGTWTTAGKSQTSVPQRAEVAAIMADEALKIAIRRGKI